MKVVNYNKLRKTKMKGRYGNESKRKFQTEEYKRARAIRRGNPRKKREEVFDQKTLHTFMVVKKK